MVDYFKKPKLHLYSFIDRRFRNYISDKTYLKIKYYLKIGKKLNLKNPKTYREKIQWIKLYDRNSKYTELVDKVLAKDFFAEKIGKEHVVPTLGVWDNPENIDFEKLPDKFVLKCNHNSHIGLSICRDKSGFDIEKAKAFLQQGLEDDYYKRSREWVYKDVKRKILAEKHLNTDNADGVLTDYKYFCFDGKAKIMYISQDIAQDPRTDFFDMEFNHLDIHMQDPPADVLPEKPRFFEEMRVAAEKLSEEIPFVRVDFYEADGTWYVGEMTFYPSSGLAPMNPEKWDEIIGSWINLPNSKSEK